MSAIGFPRGRSGQAQSGVFAVEFALVLVLFLAFVFGVVELTRAMYLFNTLQEVTRRAASGAANIDFRDNTAKNRVRQGAIFRDAPGRLILGDPVSADHVRIDYMALVRAGDGSMTLTPIDAAAMPSCPARNRVICMQDPNDPGCIRFVRVRMCEPGDPGACTQASYQTIVPFVSLPVRLPMATSIVTAETLGFTPGMTPCP
jgi:hypothetical protein